MMLSKMDTSDKPKKLNILGVGLHTLSKLKIPVGKGSRSKRGVNLWEENPPHQPTPRRDALARARSNIEDCLCDALTREKKNINACPPMNLIYDCKIMT